MALGEFSPAFAAGPPEDLIEIQAREAAAVSAYPRPKNIRITDITIPGSQRQIPARLYQPIDEAGNLLTGPLPIFVWFLSLISNQSYQYFPLLQKWNACNDSLQP